MVRKTKRVKVVLGIGVVLLFAVIGFSALGGFVSQYKTVTEVITAPQNYEGRQIQVEGDVVLETIDWSPPVLTFSMTDGVNQMDVRYEGVLPGSFPTGDIGPGSKIDVVVLGAITKSREFEANNVLVKCPSKYEKKLNETLMD